MVNRIWFYVPTLAYLLILLGFWVTNSSLLDFLYKKAESLVTGLFFTHCSSLFLYLYPDGNFNALYYKEFLSMTMGISIGGSLCFLGQHGKELVPITTFLSIAWPIWYFNAGFQVEIQRFTIKQIFLIVVLGILGCMASICLNAEVAKILFRFLEVRDLKDVDFLAIATVFSAIDTSYALKPGTGIFHVLTWEYIASCSICSLMALTLGPGTSIFKLVSEGQLNLETSIFIFLSVTQMKFVLNVIFGFMVGGIVVKVGGIMEKVAELYGVQNTTLVLKTSYIAVVIVLTMAGFSGVVVEGFSSFFSYVDIATVAAILATCIVVLTQSPRLNMFLNAANLVNATFFIRIGIAVADLQNKDFSKGGKEVITVCACLTIMSLVLRGFIFAILQYLGIAVEEAMSKRKAFGIVMFAGTVRGSTSLVLAHLMFAESKANIYQIIIFVCLATNLLSVVVSLCWRWIEGHPPVEQLANAADAEQIENQPAEQ